MKFYVGSLLSITKSGKISHYNLGHACYSQAQTELCLVLMLCFCSAPSFLQIPIVQGVQSNIINSRV